ncbi:MAG: hypothetical protein ABIM89_18405 [Mycobacteriales bacterium]
MPALNLDAELHKAMTQYLMASNRIRVAEEREDSLLLAQAEQEQRVAARTYEAALMKRGWRAPLGAFAAT